MRVTLKPRAKWHLVRLMLQAYLATVTRRVESGRLSFAAARPLCFTGLVSRSCQRGNGSEELCGMMGAQKRTIKGTPRGQEKPTPCSVLGRASIRGRCARWGREGQQRSGCGMLLKHRVRQGQREEKHRQGLSESLCPSA